MSTTDTAVHPGSLLRDEREARGLSLNDVCSELDVHPTTILRWERRERLPGPEHVRRLATMLGLPIGTVSSFFDDARSRRPRRQLGVRGDGIRCLRSARQMSAASLARLLDVPPAHVYNWEAGRARMPVDLVPALARAFHMDQDGLEAWLRVAPKAEPLRPSSSPLRQLRHRSGMSQEQVAAAIGTSRRSLGKWESGAAVPLRGIRDLARLYGVPASVVARAASVSPPRLLQVSQWKPGDVAGVLTVLRQWSGLTQARLAGLCDVSTASIRSWESGRTIPRAHSRGRLEELYGLPPGALLEAYPAVDPQRRRVGMRHRATLRATGGEGGQHERGVPGRGSGGRRGGAGPF